MSALSLPILVLNKHYLAIHVATVRQAIRKLSLGICDAIDEEDYMRYTWDEWVELPVEGNQDFIKTTQDPIRAPKIVVVNTYDQIPKHQVKLTRKNIWLRDGGRCQYTGQELSFKEMTIDHVDPESRGGANDWTNLVTCDKKVNEMKANRTPEEAGLTLIKPPTKPDGRPQFRTNHQHIYEAWLPFLGKG